MKKIILAGILMGFTIVSCNKKTETADTVALTDSLTVANDLVDSEHNAQNSLDWFGTYEGVLPCADCEGIKTTIVLNPDETFTYTAEYINKDFTEESQGNIMWHDNGSVIHLKDDENVDIRLKVIENALIHLDQEGNEIDGALKDHYQLNKIN